MSYYQRFAAKQQQIQEESTLPTNDADAVTLVRKILTSDNQSLGSKVQSFEREFDKTWERVAVDVNGSIAKLPPIFHSLKLKMEVIKQRKEHMETIFAAANPEIDHFSNNLTNSSHLSSKSLPNSSKSSKTTLQQMLHSDPNNPNGIFSNKHGVIRSVCLVVDLSESSLEKDIRPTRFDFLTTVAGQFIDAFIDQHPLSEISSLTVAQGHCKLRTEVRQPKSDYIEHLKKCQDKSEPKGGVFSIQNAIHSCGHLLQSAPPQACKEIVILTCSLNTVDVKDIEETINYCKVQNITVNIIGLDARVRIFHRIAAETGGTYIIACDSTQYGDALSSHLKPPIKQKKHSTRGWIQVAFPAVKTATFHKKTITTNSKSPSNQGPRGGNDGNDQTTVFISTLMCLCHNKLRDRVYVCPTCSSSVCQIPNQCPICKTLLLSYPLLARSASQLNVPAPTTPVHFNDQLIPLKDLENIPNDVDVDQVLRIRRPRVRFKRKGLLGDDDKGKRDEKKDKKNKKANNKMDDGINYIDDGPSITKSTEDQLVELESMTFSQVVTTAQVLKGLQNSGININNTNNINNNYKNDQNSPNSPNSQTDIKNEELSNSTTMSDGKMVNKDRFDDKNDSILQTFAVQSTTCQTHIVNCQGCTCPLIIPTTKLLETALVYADNVTNIRVCTCTVCRNTNLVTNCSLCGCFLCHDCDQLTQGLLQNCPGCYS